MLPTKAWLRMRGLTFCGSLGWRFNVIQICSFASNLNNIEVFKEQSSNSKVQSPKSKVQSPKSKVQIWNQKRDRNSVPFLIIKVIKSFSNSSLKAIRLLNISLCSLDFELWYLIIKTKGPFRAFCFNDALPLPHARGRGQVRLE